MKNCERKKNKTKRKIAEKNEIKRQELRWQKGNLYSKSLPNTMLLLLHNMLKAKLQLQKFKEKTKETLISRLWIALSVALQGYL